MIYICFRGEKKNDDNDNGDDNNDYYLAWHLAIYRERDIDIETSKFRKWHGLIIIITSLVLIEVALYCKTKVSSINVITISLLIILAITNIS